MHNVHNQRIAAGIAFVTGAFSNGVSADHPAASFGLQGFSVRTAGPITTIPAATLPQGSAAIEARAEYVRSEEYTDEDLQQLAEEEVDAHSSDYLYSGSIALGYGVTDALTVSLRLPYVNRDDLREGPEEEEPGVVEQGDSSGIGDLTALGKFRFLNISDGEQQAALMAGIKTPTGETEETTLEGELFETEHQPGSGSWDPLLGLALTQDLGSVALDASLVYAFTTEGEQDSELGDRADYSLGVSHRLGGGAHEHEHDAGSHFHTAWDLILEVNGAWEDRHEVGGEEEENSGGNVVYVSPGARFILNNRWSAFFSGGVPVVRDIRASHPENDYRLVAGFSTSF
jgi:hypothetical protein